MPHPTCRSPRPVPSAQLDLLAEQLLAARLDADRAGAALVRVGPGHAVDGLDVGLLPLPDGVHPVDALVGEVLPSRWWANGVVASAQARTLDAAGPPEPVALVVLVDRDGYCAHRIEGPTDLLPPGAAPPTGRVVDLLLRTVGRPTPPPVEPPIRWCDAVWLDRIATAVLAGAPRGRAVGELAALHPLLAAGDGPDAIVARHRTEAADPVGAWRAVRRAASRHGAPDTIADGDLRAAVGEHLAPDEVAWMDEGTLARWLDAELPPIDDLLELVTALVPGPVAHDLRRALVLDRPDSDRDQG